MSMDILAITVVVCAIWLAAVSVLPATRSMRADLIDRASWDGSSTAYAREVIGQERLTILGYLMAQRRVDALRRRDREDELLGRAAASAPRPPPTQAAQREATCTYAIWFEDTLRDPERAFDAPPAAGMSRVWFDALTVGLRVLEVRPSQGEIVTGALIEVDARMADHFSASMLATSQLLGTCAWIRNYAEPNYRDSWRTDLPLFSGPAESVRPTAG